MTTFKTYTRLICLAQLFLLGICCSAQSEAEKQYIDSLFVKATNAALTKAGLKYADELIELGHKYNNAEAYHRGLECKACIYVNEDMNDCLDAFCDSIDQHTTLQRDAPYVYYYITYTHGKAYMRQAKYHLAINLAKQMYSDGHDMMSRSDIDEELYAKGVETYVQGIDILAEAYGEIGNDSIALEYYQESVDVCRQLRYDGVSTNLLTASHGRMCTAMKMYQHTDGRKLLEYVDMFRSDLDSWVVGNQDKEYARAILPYYQSIVEYISLAACIQIGDSKSVDEHFERFMELCSAYDMSSNSDINYYSANIEYYQYKGDYKRAMAYADSTIQYQRENGMLNELRVSLTKKLLLNHLQGNYEKDYIIAEEIISLCDTLVLIRSNTSIQEMGAILGLEKAQKEAEYVKSQRTIMILYLVIGGVLLLMAVVIVVMVIRNNIKQRKTNEELDEKNNELEQQKEEMLVQNENLEMQQERIERQNHDLERQNKIITQSNNEINDSIGYASLIQRASMPSERTMRNIFGDHLLIYRPLKTVSGDFYWAMERGKYKLLAVGDCTGHGVPGAFLSILGVSILNELAGKTDLSRTNAAVLLDQMRDMFKLSLNQKEYGDEDSNHDGIDVALILINTEIKKMHYAGAFRPLIIVREGVLKKVDADRMPIGVHYMAAEHFTNHEIELRANDKLYMFSDGITDQFGYNDKGEVHKFTAKRMYSILSDSSHDPFSTQQTKVEMALDNWRLEGIMTTGEKYEQTDDIVMVGIGV